MSRVKPRLMAYLKAMIVTVINLFNASTTQYYVRLVPGIVDEAEKERLLRVFNAVPAAKYLYNQEPKDVNVLYFQEFDEPDTHGYYFNINGDRPIYDMLHDIGKEPEYVI